LSQALRRGLAVAVVTIAAAVVPAASAAPALAAVRGSAHPNAVVVCTPLATWYTWSQKATPWVLHQFTYEHFTGSQGTYTKVAATQTTIAAAVTYTTGTKASGELPIASLCGETSLSLKAEGSRTVSSSVTLTENLTHYAVYVFYDGSRRASGNFKYNVCNSNGTAVTVLNTGSAVSWDQPRDGGLACDTTPPSGTLAATVKTRYC
jgi:hypothetical protein